MAKTKNEVKPAAIDKVAQKMDKVVDKFMDKMDKAADKMDKAKPGAEDKVADKVADKVDKAVDNFTDKMDKLVDKIVDKEEPDVSEDQDVAWYQYGGDALALGQNTFTLVETTGKIVDHGRVTTAKIDIKATAAAEGGSTDASAATYVDSNSDISLLIKFKDGVLESDGVSYTISNAKFIGLCLPDDVNLPNGAKNIVIELDIDADLDFDLDGNVATVTFDVEVLGNNTLAITDAYALAIEDTLSNSSFQVEAAVA